MTLLYFRMEQSADMVGKVEKVFILFGIDRPSSPTSG